MRGRSATIVGGPVRDVDESRAAFAGGMRLDEARRQFKYHQLQSREDDG